MTEQPCIKSSQEGGVARLVLSNPARRNAFTHAMREALVEEMDAFNRNPEIRAVVLTGDGKHFCVGADISASGPPPTAPPVRLEIRERLKDVQKIYHLIATAPKPYVAAVGGDAFGAGMSMALACDFIVGGPEARFGTAFARVGGYPEMGAVSTLSRRVGQSRAKRLLMLCEHVSADEALRIGLLDELTDGDHIEAATALARSLAAAAPMSLAYIKATFADRLPSAADAIRTELDVVPTLMGASEDSAKACPRCERSARRGSPAADR